MRRLLIAAAALGLVLLLAACGGSDSGGGAAWTDSQGQDILSSGAFSEELEELDADTAWMLYRLGDAGLERDSLTQALCRRSAGATCEELAVLTFDSETSAQSAVSALEDYIQGQITSNRDYRPAEIPKLEGAWIDQRGSTVLMVVANDLDAAKSAVQ